MKGFASLAGAAVVLTAFSAQTFAADLPQPADPGPAYTVSPDTISGFDWTGPYAGAQLGWGWGSFTTRSTPTGKFDNDANGVLGGFYGGYNFMVTPNILAGLEGTFDFTNLNDRTSAGGINYKTGSDWNSTVRGRLGYAFDTFLIYGTGGLAIADLDVNASGNKDSTTAIGWTLGAGVETALSEHVTMRLDYAYENFGKESFNLGGTTYKTDLDNNVVRAGVAYKF